MSLGGTPRCEKCGQLAYHAEQVMGPGRKIYHKMCLKCEQCGKRLDPGSLVQHDNIPYCARCHTQLFGTRDLRHANVNVTPQSSPARAVARSSVDDEPSFPRPISRPVPPPQDYYTPPDLGSDQNLTSTNGNSTGIVRSAQGGVANGTAGSADKELDPDTEITRPDFRSHRPIAVPFAGGAKALDDRGLLSRGASPRSKVGERIDFEDGCAGCGKRVYAAEQVYAIAQKWHRGCLRCVSCNSTIDPSKVSDRDGKPWCKNCYAREHGPGGIAGKR